MQDSIQPQLWTAVNFPFFFFFFFFFKKNSELKEKKKKLKKGKRKKKKRRKKHWRETHLRGTCFGIWNLRWQNNADFGIYGADPFTTCPSQLSVRCSPPYDLNRVIFSNSQKSPDLPQVPSSSPKIESAPPLLRKLLDCARLAESKPNRAMKTLIALRKSVSKHGDPTKRVGYYFS